MSSLTKMYARSNNMQATTDVVIIGGGIIGCAIAYFLRKLDRDVLVLEKGEIGSQASSASAGLLAPLGSLAGPGQFADLLLESWAMFPSLVPELEETSGLSLAYEQTGSLRIVRNSKNATNLRKRMKVWQPLGLTMHWLDGEEARQREPLLTSDASAAIYAPEEAQLKAPQAVKAFAQAATRRGATMLSHQEILGVARTGSRVTAVYTAQGETITC